MPGKDGLLHISEIDWKRYETIEETGIKEGDKIQVKLIDIDPKTGKFKLSRRALIEKPEGYQERPARAPRQQGERPQGDRQRGDRQQGDRPDRQNRRRNDHQNRQHGPRQERNDEDRFNRMDSDQPASEGRPEDFDVNFDI